MPKVTAKTQIANFQENQTLNSNNIKSKLVAKGKVLHNISTVSLQVAFFVK